MTEKQTAKEHAIQTTDTNEVNACCQQDDAAAMQVRTQQRADNHAMTDADQNTASGWTYRPHTDVFDLPEQLQMQMDLPGARPDSINVEFEDGVLSVDAQIQPRFNGQTRRVRAEYGVGNFHRRFEIGESIDADNIQARYEHGVLIVHLPKQQSAQRRRIEIAAA